MDKSQWPDLGAPKNFPRRQAPIHSDKTHSFAGALRKPTFSSDPDDSVQADPPLCNPERPEPTPQEPEQAPSETKETDASYVAPQPVEAGAAHSGPPPDDWKLTQKLRKLALKKEKRLKKEEEQRRQMVAPKGYRVQLVAAASSAPVAAAPSSSELSREGEAFPALGSQHTRPRALESAVLTRERSPPSRLRARRRDPITLDLQQVMLPRVRKQAPDRHENRRSGTSEEVLSGNPLDSTQPQRHRGKVREKPRPKHHSTLKSAVLRHRQKKQALRQQQQQLTEHHVSPENCQTVADSLDGESRAEPVEVEHQTTQQQEDPVEKQESAKDCTNLQNEGSATDHLVEESLKLFYSAANIENLANISTRDIIHSLKFRDYCDHTLSSLLNDAVHALLSRLVALQDRAHARDPAKARVRKRLLVGLHETRKALRLKRVLLLLIAPDLEKCPEPGGLDSKVAELITLARQANTPVAFSLGRRKLGRVLLKKVPVSCVAILNVEEAEELLCAVTTQLPALRDSYRAIVIPQTDQETVVPEERIPDRDVNTLVVSNLLSALEESLQTPRKPAFLQAIESVQEQDSD